MEGYYIGNSSNSSTYYDNTDMYKKDAWGNTLISTTNISSPWKEFLSSTIKSEDIKDSKIDTGVSDTQEVSPSWDKIFFPQGYDDDSHSTVSLLRDRIRLKKKKLAEVYDKSKGKFDSVTTFMSALTWVMDEINRIEEYKKYGTTGEF